MPRVTIYSDQQITSVSSVAEVSAILLGAGFKNSDIAVVHCDPHTAEAIGGGDSSSHCSAQSSPCITYEGKIVAQGMEDIRKADEDGRLRALAPQAPPPVPTGATWWNPAAALMAYWTGPEEPMRGPSLGEPEYEVTRYNWLWRPQRRVYRFGETGFDRIRPDSRVVRQTFKYDDILAMTMREDDYLVISFRSGAEAQHMKSPFVSVIRDLILLRLKALAVDVKRSED